LKAEPFHFAFSGAFHFVIFGHHPNGSLRFGARYRSASITLCSIESGSWRRHPLRIADAEEISPCIFWVDKDVFFGLFVLQKQT